MPQVRFRVNFGRFDANTLKEKTGCDLDHNKCTEGTEHDVNERACEWLSKRGIVELTSVKAVAKQPELTGRK